MQEDVGLWLGIRRRDIDIELFPRKGFLLLLPSSELHDHALSSNGSVPVGRAKLQLLSWTRLVGAEAAKLPFKVRLYVEGVPHHARQESTLWQLIPWGSLLECFNLNAQNDNEASYYCIIKWLRDLDEFTLEDTLLLEDLLNQSQTAWYFIDPVVAVAWWPHTVPVHILCYEVLLHIDQIVDYHPLSTMSQDWPERRSFQWCLGFRDD
jgi:hypothetical protein